MFRHRGKGRTYKHNLTLASILSCVAGVVNTTGFLKLNTLTTNVTGHFAFFSEQIALSNYKTAFVILFYILFFLLGAFVSSCLVEWVSMYKPQISYILPISIEALILLSVAFSENLLKECAKFSTLLSSSLLFSMGLQNALVTRISQSVVRTTHLTGLFTDLGIELSQLLFYKTTPKRIQLHKNIFLKLTIVCSFFLGCLSGGLLYTYLGLKTLFFPAAMLILGLWYDRLLFRYYYLKRKFRNLK